jgi:hypothetical protein
MTFKNNRKNTWIIIVIIIVVLLAGAAWYVFSNPTIESELGFRSSAMQSMNGGNMSTTPGRFEGAHGGFAMGSIEALNDNGFTLTLSDGTTKNVVLLATTTIQNFATASSTPTVITADQLSVGEQVLAMGPVNADGSINARVVRTGTFPTMRGGRSSGGQGGQTPGGATPPTPTQ